jgi:hypothetical protein
MYAILLTSGQTLTVNQSSQALTTYTGPMTVVLNEEEYQQINLSGYNDISHPDLAVLNIPIPSTPGVLCGGRFAYAGYYASATTTQGYFTLSDSVGPTVVEYATILDFNINILYPIIKTPEYEGTGIPILGTLNLSSITAPSAFLASVRIVAR